MALTINGKSVTPRTLTVAEIHRLVKDLGKKKKADIIELLFDSPIPTEAVLLSSGLDIEDLTAESVLPQEINRLIDEVGKKNPFFLAMMKRAVAMAETEPTSPPPSAA